MVRRLISGREFRVEEIYINLALVQEQEVKEQEKGLKIEKSIQDVSDRYLSYEHIYGEKKDVTVEKIFDPFDDKDKEPHKKLLILGRAGCGKSTLCKYIARRWARQDADGATCTILWTDRFEWVFWMPLRNLITHKYTDLKNVRYDAIV